MSRSEVAPCISIMPRVSFDVADKSGSLPSPHSTDKGHGKHCLPNPTSLHRALENSGYAWKEKLIARAVSIR